MSKRFSSIAQKVTEWAGSPFASLTAFVLVAIWTVGGIVFGFSDSYQIIINTGTTIVTFVMVFLIQASQNRDGRALQLKLDTIIAALERAPNKAIGLQKMAPDEMEAFARELAEELHEYDTAVPSRHEDTGDPT